MAEFCTVVGTLSACMSIISSVGNTVRTLRDLQIKFKEAQQSIDLMLGRLGTIKLALTRIHSWVRQESHLNASKDSVEEGITVALVGCREAMDALFQDVNRLVTNPSTTALGFVGSTRYLWNSATMKEHEDRLKLHVDYLFILVQAVQCTSNTERASLVTSKKYITTRHEILEDTCSLKSARTPSRSNTMSNLTGRRSISNPKMEIVDTICGESRPYQRVMAAQHKQRHAFTNSPPHLGEDLGHVPDKRRNCTSLPRLDIEQAERQRKPILGPSTPLMKSSPTLDEGYHSKNTTPASTERFSSTSSASPSSFWNNYNKDNSDLYRSRTTNVLPYTEKPTSALTASTSPIIETKGIRKMLSTLSFRRNSRSNQVASKNFPGMNPSIKQSLTPSIPWRTFESGVRRSERSRYRSVDLKSTESHFVPRLVKAAQEGSDLDVTRLLDQGKNIDEAHLESGRSALAVAAHCGNFAVVQTLLEREACHDRMDNDQCTPLHLAASRGHLDVVVILVQNGAKIEQRDFEKRTALWLAASNGHIDVVEFLLIHHAKVSVRAKDQRSLLHHITSQGDHRITELLLRYNADVDAKDSSSMTAIHYACREGHKEVIELLIAHGAGKDSLGPFCQTPLMASAAAGQRHIVELLLKRKVNIKAKDNSCMNALHWACQNGHADVADLLLSKSLPINSTNSQNQTPLHIAVMNQHFDVVELLIRRQASLDSRCKKGNTPLHYACGGDDLTIIRMLIDNGADVEAVTSLEGAKPLHIAVSHGKSEVVELLLACNVIVDSPDEKGDRPLILACFHGYLPIVELLINAGSSLNSRHKGQRSARLDSALCAAAQQGRLEICAFLVEKGASVEQADESFWTPLRYAVHYGHPEVLGLLLICDAEVPCGVHRDWDLDALALEFGFSEEPEISQDCKEQILRLLQQAVEVGPASVIAESSVSNADGFSEFNRMTGSICGEESHTIAQSLLSSEQEQTSLRTIEIPNVQTQSSFELEATEVSVKNSIGPFELETAPYFAQHEKKSTDSSTEARAESCSDLLHTLQQSSSSSDSKASRISQCLQSLPPQELTVLIQAAQQLQAQGDPRHHLPTREKLYDTNPIKTNFDGTVENDLSASSLSSDAHFMPWEQPKTVAPYSECHLSRHGFPSESFKAGDESEFSVVSRKSQGHTHFDTKSRWPFSNNAKEQEDRRM